MFGRRSRKKRGGSKGKCRRGIVRFKTKRGKTIQFKGKTGSGCAPRKKPSTRHLASYKRAMAAAARSCRGKKGKTFRRCVAAKL